MLNTYQPTDQEDVVEPFIDLEFKFWNKISASVLHQSVIGEAPLSIHIQGKPYSVVMRTPGYEKPHAAGLCFAEGIVDAPDDILSIEYKNGETSDTIKLDLSKPAQIRLAENRNRRGCVDLTGHGLSAGKLMQDLLKEIRPVHDDTQITIKEAFEVIQRLPALQGLRDQTKASHAAALFSSDFELLTVAEDVGRHNALDKAIGALFLNQKMDIAKILVLSSRISYELVQKASRARIPIILAMSRPTSLALEAASQLNISLASDAKGSGLYMFCGQQRFL